MAHKASIEEDVSICRYLTGLQRSYLYLKFRYLTCYYRWIDDDSRSGRFLYMIHRRFLAHILIASLLVAGIFLAAVALERSAWFVVVILLLGAIAGILFVWEFERRNNGD